MVLYFGIYYFAEEIEETEYELVIWKRLTMTSTVTAHSYNHKHNMR